MTSSDNQDALDLDDDESQVEDDADETAVSTSLLAPVNYFDPEDRIAAAILLGELARGLPDNQDPILPGGFCLPG